MRRGIISVFYLWLKQAEKGRGAGIEHSTVAMLTGLLTFLNINTIQAFLGSKPFLLYEYGKLYFVCYLILVMLVFKVFFRKSYIMGHHFTPEELRMAKIILLTYFTLTLLALILSMIFSHRR